LKKAYKSRILKIGNLSIGGAEAVRIQSMTNTSTADKDACIRQISGLYEAGCEMVRLSVKNMDEVENLVRIREGLEQQGIFIPLVADIHFNPRLAEKAAEYVHKIRINPGNYLDRQHFLLKEKTAEGKKTEATDIKEGILRLIRICKKYGTVIRVGVNHGSLSDRIMQQYGNTAEGMVASAMEFLEICRDHGFNDLLVSMKSSHVLTMVKANLLLVDAMSEHGMDYPIHLGVTEAGEGEDGRIRSAAGIGPLLAMGIGDTIRVSLTEDPLAEIPVARRIVGLYDASRKVGKSSWPQMLQTDYDYKNTTPSGIIGGSNPVVVLGDGHDIEEKKKAEIHIITETVMSAKDGEKYTYIRIPGRDELIAYLNASYSNENREVLLFAISAQKLDELADMFSVLQEYHCDHPVLIRLEYREKDQETLLLKSASDFSCLILNGYGNGYQIKKLAENSLPEAECMYGILQATGRRITETEYISCPTCGRTSFDIQGTLKEIKAHTAGLTAVKIAVMGCIVNGPGEMAEADFGYVGAGRGKVTLYHRGKAVKKNIPEKEALNELLELIKRSQNEKD
jgi:(E)-4-hydroxy-3-methylbut-2-enyl-diphosphate synthase